MFVPCLILILVFRSTSDLTPAPLPAQVVNVLIHNFFDLLVDFLRGRGLVKRVVNHIGTYSMLELLVLLGWDDGSGAGHDVVRPIAP